MNKCIWFESYGSSSCENRTNEYLCPKHQYDSDFKRLNKKLKSLEVTQQKYQLEFSSCKKIADHFGYKDHEIHLVIKEEQHKLQVALEKEETKSAGSLTPPALPPRDPPTPPPPPPMIEKAPVILKDKAKPVAQISMELETKTEDALGEMAQVIEKKGGPPKSTEGVDRNALLTQIRESKTLRPVAPSLPKPVSKDLGGILKNALDERRSQIEKDSDTEEESEEWE